MVNYQLGKIYKIINTTNDVYIGSTCEKYLCQRLAKHKSHFEEYKKGKMNYCTSFKLLQEDYDNCEIILVENVPCDNKDELHQRERFYIETVECVNKCIPGRTINEYRKDKCDEIKEKRKEYVIQNKEKIKDQHRIWSANYRLVNAEEIKKKKKLYQENNKEKLRLKRLENRDKYNEYKRQMYKAKKELAII